ncbi:MAG: recombinase family protein [Myxococcota bacterium]
MRLGSAPRKLNPASGYTRVSSRSQDLATQRSAIERAAAARGDRIVEWFEEKASARTIDRVGLQRLREAARRGELPVAPARGARVYTFRVDRLARSGIRDTFEIIEELKAAGVELISVADGFDLQGPASEIVLAVMSWAARMERLAINERISAARARAEASGGRWGRPRRLDDRGVARVRDLRRSGRTIRQIAVALKVPKSSVARALSR